MDSMTNPKAIGDILADYVLEDCGVCIQDIERWVTMTSEDWTEVVDRMLVRFQDHLASLPGEKSFKCANRHAQVYVRAETPEEAKRLATEWAKENKVKLADWTTQVIPSKVICSYRSGHDYE